MKSVSGAKKSSAPDALLRALKKSEVRNSCFLTSDFFVTFFGGGDSCGAVHGVACRGRRGKRSASMDKTRVVAGVYGSQAINDRWRIGAEVGLAQGAHDQDVTASLSLRYSW